MLFTAERWLHPVPSSVHDRPEGKARNDLLIRPHNSLQCGRIYRGAGRRAHCQNREMILKGAAIVLVDHSERYAFSPFLCGFEGGVPICRVVFVGQAIAALVVPCKRVDLVERYARLQHINEREPPVFDPRLNEGRQMNIGTPAISFVGQAGAATWTVLEVSSFQLETIVEFRPRIAVILNITPDHLDRHKTFANYVNAKARIFENQLADDFTVLNADDPTTAGLSGRTHARLFWFSRMKEGEQGAFIRGTHIYFRDGQSELEIMPLAEVPLKGAHNLENVLAGVSIGSLVGCSPEQIRHAVQIFKAVEHRLEFVARVAGVDYYNDSKATNVDATVKALESFPANILLILGGKDKGSDYTVLNELLRQRVKRVYTIGAAAAKIESQIQGAAEIDHAETLENAVRRASESAGPGDVVLLAPACASFDQFQSYEHRGRVFKETVHSLGLARST